MLALWGTTLFEGLEPARARVGFHLFQKRHPCTARRKIVFNLLFPGSRFEFSEPVSQLAPLGVGEMLDFLLDGLQVHVPNLTHFAFVCKS